MNPFAEPVHWARIYKTSFKDEDGNPITTAAGENIYILFQVLLKGNRYTKLWYVFLCSPQSFEALANDQEGYRLQCRQWLEMGHEQPPAGGLN